MQTDCFPNATGDWAKHPVQAIADVNPRYRVLKNRDYPFIEMASVGENFGGVQHIDKRKPEGSGLSRFKVGDTLFAKITPCPQNGKVAFVESLPAEIGIGSTEFIVLAPKDESDGRFLYHLVCSHDVRGRAVARMEGSTGRQRVPDEVFEKRLLVPVPPPDERQTIANVLDAVDTAIKLAREAVKCACVLRDGLIQQVLESGIDEKGRIRCAENDPAAFNVTELGRLPKAWTVRSLAGVADVERGRFSPRPRNDPRFYNGQYPFIQTGQVAEAKGRVITGFTQTLNDIGKTVSREFPVGTIMVTIAANIGETAILGIPMCAPDSLVGVSVKKPNVPRFVELCLRRLRRKLLALAPRSAQANINLTTLKPLRIPVPPAPEQELIALLVDSADKYVQSLEQREVAFVTLKKSLMLDLLTGKVRVNNVNVRKILNP